MVVSNQQTILDSAALFNQPVAKEGVLPYKDGNKLKRWADLQKNIGRVVPVLDEHPSRDNGNFGLYSGKEKVHGMATLKQCPNGKKKLCADIKLEDGAPVKNGYSVGYPYEEVQEAGELEGQKYDSIQAGLVVNHVALTDDPRDEQALQIIGDSHHYIVGSEIKVGKESDFHGNGAIHITRIGYDSFRFDADSSGSRMATIKDKLAKDNPAMPLAELESRASLMYQNERKLKVDSMVPNPAPPASEEEKKKEEEKEKPPMTGDSTREALLIENARLKAEAAAQKRAADSVKESDTKLKAAQDAAEKYRQALEDRITKDVNSKIGALVKVRGFDAKEFDGKSADFVDGAYYFHERISSGADGAGEPESTESDAAEANLSINDYKYDWDSKKMVIRPEVAAQMGKKKGKGGNV